MKGEERLKELLAAGEMGQQLQALVPLPDDDLSLVGSQPLVTTVQGICSLLLAAVHSHMNVALIHKDTHK